MAQDSCANLKCIDLDPGPNGVKNQIMAMEIQDGQGPYPSRYTSFWEYLHQHWEYLATGQYTVEDGFLTIEPTR